jgi:hypothetical protein
MAETATLIVSGWHTTCSNCMRQVLPNSKTHEEISGYVSPNTPGCGVLFTAITTDMLGITRERLSKMRPDLPVVDM